MVDDVDVREYNQKTLRDKIAIALQKSELFSTEIQENIAWGRPDASEDDIVCASKIAQADGFIQSMPNGYAAMVAERGMSLSGGQKQRISIARAILSRIEACGTHEELLKSSKTYRDIYDSQMGEEEMYDR